MTPTIHEMKSAYDKHKHLKIAADSIGMKWQTLYWHLKKSGHPIQGDKESYGSEKDKFAATSERDFQGIIGREIKNLNTEKFQSKYDFEINGLKVDIKASRLHNGSKQSKAMRWAFSLKKQEMVADFIVCMAYKENQLFKIFLIPRESLRYRSTISISENLRSKWVDYLISEEDLKEFFQETTKQAVFSGGLSLGE